MIATGVLKAAAINVAALASGILVALLGVAPEASIPAAEAANHCTKYAPNVVVDGACYQYGYMYASNTYKTPSTGLRDKNHIEFERCTNSWWLWYEGGNGASASGTGCAGNVNSGSGGYAKSACFYTGVSPDLGVCNTLWHD